MASNETRRDVRIDRIGFVSELGKQFADPLRLAVRDAHEVGARLQGDCFEGLLYESGSAEVDSGKFLKLLEQGKISRDQYLAAVAVSVTEARRILDEKTFDRVAVVGELRKALKISRLKGVSIELIMAVDQVRSALSAPNWMKAA